MKCCVVIRALPREEGWMPPTFPTFPGWHPQWVLSPTFHAWPGRMHLVVSGRKDSHSLVIPANASLFIDPFPERKTAAAPMNFWSHLPPKDAGRHFRDVLTLLYRGWLQGDSNRVTLPIEGPKDGASSLLSNFYFCICVHKMKLLKLVRVTGHENEITFCSFPGNHTSIFSHPVPDQTNNNTANT